MNPSNSPFRGLTSATSEALHRLTETMKELAQAEMRRLTGSAPGTAAFKESTTAGVKALKSRFAHLVTTSQLAGKDCTFEITDLTLVSLDEDGLQTDQLIAYAPGFRVEYEVGCHGPEIRWTCGKMAPLYMSCDLSFCINTARNKAKTKVWVLSTSGYRTLRAEWDETMTVADPDA